jgi:hypothetical protein
VRNVENFLLGEVEYRVVETSFGVWRRFGYPTGQVFAEFKSHARIMGMPLVHYTYGRCPETGRRIMARGFIAVGRLALGVIAVGHASAGIVAVGQLALGLVVGLGQLATGLFALGQVAVGVLFGLGQLATGHAAIGQLALGKYALAQFGIGEHVCDTRACSEAAKEFFRSLIK